MIGVAAQFAAGVAVAVWAIRAANRHQAGTPAVERVAVSVLGAAGMLAAISAVLRGW